MAEPQSAVEGDRYHATGAFERRSVSSYIIARPEERVPTGTGLALRHVEGELVATAEMRPPRRRGGVTEEALARVAEIASHLSPLDDDLLDLLVSNARKNSPFAQLPSLISRRALDRPLRSRAARSTRLW